jgi:hypothetical protein
MPDLYSRAFFHIQSVHAPRTPLSGSGHFFQILEPGGKTLENPETVRAFWNAFRAEYPKAEGFMPVKPADGSGISILKVRGHFSEKDVEALQTASEKAADRVKMQEIETTHGARRCIVGIKRLEGKPKW